jgi:hypothetical protein
MYVSRFMVEQEIQLRRSKVRQRQAEQRRLAIEAADHQRLRWPDLSVLTMTVVRWRRRWLTAEASPC